MGVLTQLETLMADHEPHAAPSTLRASFLALWQDYYSGLLELLFARVDPLAHLPTSAGSREKLPREIAKYVGEQEGGLETKVESYGQELKVLFANLKELMGRSRELATGGEGFDAETTQRQITTLYCSKVSALNDAISAYASAAAQAPSLPALRSLILLFALAHHFNAHLATAALDPVLAPIATSTLVCNESVLRSFGCVFEGGRLSWGVQFDQFFMSYASCAQQTDLLRRTVLLLLEGRMQKADPERTKTLLLDRH